MHARRKKEGAIPATTDAVDCRSLRSPPPEELSVLGSFAHPPQLPPRRFTWDESNPSHSLIGLGDPICSRTACRNNLTRHVDCNPLSHHNRLPSLATDRVCSPSQAITMNEVIVRIWAELSSNIDCCQKKFPRFVRQLNQPFGSRLADSLRCHLSVCLPLAPKELAVHVFGVSERSARRLPGTWHIWILSAKGNRIGRGGCKAACDSQR